ncbi:RNase H domain-containing protein [Trichonephila clavipes]|uniref:RNase H domain-containing protein n=1 Tax=Trichonephila clavipes TaxID=2585209 RepID=A0A8X6SE22_TRICX|nr:RNase H domain-containing protein [Trichonephila clavipes]
MIMEKIYVIGVKAWGALHYLFTLTQHFGIELILTDSRSSIQHLWNWPSINQSTSRSILHLFQQLSDWHPIHLQWVLSHVGLPRNEVVDDLAKAATSDPVNPEDHMVLTSTEIYSRAKELICRTWVVPPVLSKTPWICHIIQGFQIISGIIAIFYWSPEVHEF